MKARFNFFSEGRWLGRKKKPRKLLGQPTKAKKKKRNKYEKNVSQSISLVKGSKVNVLRCQLGRIISFRFQSVRIQVQKARFRQRQRH